MTNYANYITPREFKFLESINNLNIDSLPKHQTMGLESFMGVYFLHNEDGNLMYIGKSENVYNRIMFHTTSKKTPFSTFSYVKHNDYHDVNVMERFLINKFLPEYNRDMITMKIRSKIQK